MNTILNELSLWRYDRTLELEKEKSNKINIYNLQEKCYHYTTLDTFWRIIGSETFRATHMRFSNDSEEYLQGSSFVNDILKSTYGDLDDKIEHDHYMICFSRDNNVLSQWREYAQRGVSIEMDFSRNQHFSIIMKSQNIENRNPTTVEKYLHKPAIPINVLYVMCKCKDYINDNDCLNACSHESIKKKELSYYEFKNVEDEFFSFDQLKDFYIKHPSRYHRFYKKYKNLIPYIKRYDFYEEREARLIFSLTRDEQYEYVEYDNVDNLKRPYCSVRCENIGAFNKDCTYVQFGEDVEPEVKNKVKYMLGISQIDVLTDVNRLNDESKMPMNIPPKDGNIYISAGKNQREVFKKIEEVVREKNKDQKIWCDGHWPIRSILVGPTANKEQIVESIKQYCANHHWLKHVDVGHTSTPYREKKHKA